MDSIYALSSGAVPAGVAVIRLCGPLAGEALRSLAGMLPEPRRATLKLLRRPGTGEVLDQALVLWFPGPGSETGEDMAELQAHGSRAVVQALFTELSALGLRLAEPGEFARRAFRNGKLDLTGLEGLADLVAAETEMQRRQAVRQASGALARRAAAWRQTIISLRSEIEARLDFSDEGDVAEALPASFGAQLDALREELRAARVDADRGERLRDGFRVVLMGPPNAGKSSLLNALARRDVAIVTPEAGTTRDVLEVALDLGGYPVRVFDTAGIRETQSLPEREGVRRAQASGADADLVLWLQEAGATSILPPVDGALWRVVSKCDLGRADGAFDLEVSVVTGAGLTELLARLQNAAANSLGSGNGLVVRQRQAEAVKAALAALDHVSASSDEVAADLLRQAGEAMGRLTGRIDVEDVLDRLFSSFCIGK